MSKFYTLDDIMELKPCHSRAKLETYMAGRKRIPIADVLSSKASDEDKVWLAVRLLETDKVVEFANWCAKRAKKYANCSVYAADAAREAMYTATARSTCAVHATYAADAATHAAARAAVAGEDERKAQVNKLKEMI